MSPVDGPRVAKYDLMFCRVGRVQSSVRPVMQGQGLLALMDTAKESA